MENKHTAIARTGTFRDSEGRKRIFTKNDLKKISDNYGVSETKAPLVIGHVKSDSAPAYGWVEKLFTENDRLCATFSYVDENVKNLVYKGAYKNVSMSVDMENHRLLHVALLGAAAPAIDGLGAINLNLGENASIFSMENHEDKKMNEEELKQKIAELEKEILELKNSLAQSDSAKEEAEKKAEDIQAEFSAYIAKQADEARRKRVEKLIEEGKLEPAKKDEVYAFASQLAKSPADFSMGAKTMKMEEKYFQDLEERQPSGLFASFSHKPGHCRQEETRKLSPQTIISKL